MARAAQSDVAADAGLRGEFAHEVLEFFRGGGAGEDGLRAAGEDDLGGGEEGGENFTYFAFPAAGEEGEEVGVALTVAEDVEACGHGVSDEIGVQSGFFVEFFFEREDAEHAVEPAGHAGEAGAIPSPDLGADVVEQLELGAVRLEGFGQAKVEAGVIDEEDGVGLFPVDALEGLVEFSAEPAVAPKDIPEADHGGFVGPVFDLRAKGMELGTTEAGDAKVGPEGAEVGKQGGGVGVAAGFAGYDKEAHGIRRAAGRARRSGG